MPWSIKVRAYAHQGGGRSVLGRRKSQNKKLQCRKVLGIKDYALAYLAVSDSLSLEVGVKCRAGVWLSVWGGEVMLRTKEGLYVGYFGSGTVSLLYLEEGTYLLQVRDARILGFSGKMRREYEEVGPSIAVCRELDDFIKAWEESYCREIVENVFSFVAGRTEQVYEMGIKDKLGMWAWRVRTYLDLHFLDPDLSSERLEAHFGIREYSLRQQFQREFKVSPHEYYTSRRLRYYLQNYKGVSPGKCYWECGYHAESTFRYELKCHGVVYRGKMG